MKKVRLLFVVVSMLFCGLSYAQNNKVTGTVTDKETGEALPGVSILIKGTTTGTVTNFDGQFTLNVPSDGVLQSTFIGYKPIEIPVNGQTNIPIQLEQDMVALDEVVAIGYGTVKKRDVTGSVSSIGGESLTAAPILSIDQGMQGKLAGVNMQQMSGAPGQKMKIRIRGGSSINYSNEPIYVIDGFIGADITTVNPQDIQSIDILKDASATAIYGSRGANGVVLITTKSAEKGKMKVEFDGTVGFTDVINSYNIASPGEFAELRNEYAADLGNDPAFSQEEIDEFYNGKGTDWLNEVSRSAVTQKYSLNISGGSDKLSYLFSAGYTDEQGVILESYRKLYSLRSNVDVKVADWLDMKFNTYATHTNSMHNGQTFRAIYDALNYPVLWDSKDENGEYIDPLDQPTYGIYGSPNANPIQYIETTANGENLKEKLISSLSFTAKLSPHWELFVYGSGMYSSGFNGKRNEYEPITTQREQMTAQQQYNRAHKLMTTDMLTYTNEFGKHNIKISGAYEYSYTRSQSNSVTIANLATLGNEWYLLSNGEPTIASSNFSELKMQSYMGRFNYNYDDKYLITATMRADGTSVYQPENQWGYFPSAAFAWRMKNESYLQDVDWLYDLKLRVGWGQVGNSVIDPYDTQPTLDYKTSAHLYYPFDGVSNPMGILSGDVVDPNLQWETTEQTNVGVDLSLMGGKLSFVADYYNKKVKDVILRKSIAKYNGKPSITGNFAEISNHGLELSADYTIVNNSDFTWSAFGNISFNTNEAKDLGGEEQISIHGEENYNIWNIDRKFVVEEGESLGSFWGIAYERLWQLGEEEAAAKYNANPGEPKYTDLNNDGVIDASDRQIIGKALPDFTYGIGTSVSYKNLDLTIQGHGSHGNDLYNYNRCRMDDSSLFFVNPDYFDRWTPTNTDATQQAFPVGTEIYKTNVTSQYIEDASFFKISNITLGYSLPKSIAEQLKVRSLRLYGSVNNVLTITNYSGLDPEMTATSSESDSQSGVDAYSYPLARTWTFGLKASF